MLPAELSARAALHLLADESLLVASAAVNMASGTPPGEVSLQRLLAAATRILEIGRRFA